MDYSLLIGIERNENQKDLMMLRASYLEDKKDSTFSFKQIR